MLREVDHLEGYFGLVLWMDKYLPMVMGREIMGAAKTQAEVPPMRTFYSKKYCSMSEEGSLLIEGEFWGLKELSKDQIAASLADISCPTYLPVKRDVAADVDRAGHGAFP
jgi:hypothetical protein